MKNILMAILFFSIPFFCPYWAFGQRIDGLSKSEFAPFSEVRQGKSLKDFLVLAESSPRMGQSNPAEFPSVGGVSDGGSTGLYLDHQWMLLDLYVANPLFREARKGSPLISRFGKPNPSIVVNEQPAFYLALEMLGNKQIPKGIKAVIVEALTNMELWMTTGELPVRRAYIPAGLKEQVPAPRIVSIAWRNLKFS